MMIYAVEVAAITHYKVYVHDETGEMSEEEIINEAKCEVIKERADPDPELEIEEDDIVSAFIDYDFTDD